MMRIRATVPIPMYMSPPSLLDPASAFRFDRPFPELSDRNRTPLLRQGLLARPGPFCHAEKPPKRHHRRQRPTYLHARGRSHARPRPSPAPSLPSALLEGSQASGALPPHRVAPDASKPVARPSRHIVPRADAAPRAGELPKGTTGFLLDSFAGTGRPSHRSQERHGQSSPRGSGFPVTRRLQTSGDPRRDD